MDFKNAEERRAWLLARVEEVERRRNANSKIRQILQNSNRARVRAHVRACPGSTVQQIATALSLTPAQVWGTDLQHDPAFYQTGGSPRRRGHPVRWWPLSHPGPNAEGEF